MTLARLIEAVGAGTARPGQYGHPDVMFMEVWPPTVSGPQLWQYASEAYDGSLDAAKRLHDALLPDAEWYPCLRREGRHFGHMYPTDDGEEGVYSEADNPARAWLLAILRAMEGRDG